MSKEPKILFLGRVENGAILWDRPHMRYSQLLQLEGKEIQETISERSHSTSDSMRGFYFGGIIKCTLMQTEEFAGYTKEEIHQTLMKELRSYNKEVSGKQKTFVDEFRNFNRKQVNEFVEDVLNFLGTLDIQVLTPEEYKLGKYLNKQ